VNCEQETKQVGIARRAGQTCELGIQIVCLKIDSRDASSVRRTDRLISFFADGKCVRRNRDAQHCVT
jgi:hypothetical protein